MARGMRPRPRPDDGARHAAHLRGMNLQRVLAVAMSRSEPFTRSEIVEATGLSVPTVGSLTADLIRSGIVRDLGTGPSSGGRRPAFMEFNARHGFVAGIDIGPTRTRLAVADLRGEALAHRVIPTPKTDDPASMLTSVAAEVRSLMREAQMPASRLLAVAAGAPGAVDPKRGLVIALAPNLEGGWSDVPMASTLRKALGAPVVVENDVNLAILGERWRGAAKGHETCAFISIGTGIGAGIVVKGELHHGDHCVAGEIALMCMGPQYVETDFGSRGCFETLAGLKALAERWSGKGAVPQDGWVRALFDAAGAGDAQAQRIVDDTVKLIGMATANLDVVLDPSLIILGGSLVAQAPEVIDQVRRIVARIVPTPSRIVEPALAEEAPLWGSVLMATTEARERLRRQLCERPSRLTADRSELQSL
jgi:glucokinase